MWKSTNWNPYLVPVQCPAMYCCRTVLVTYLAHVLTWSTFQVLGLSNRRQHTNNAACQALEISFSIGNLVRRVGWLVSLNVRTCAYREVLVVQYASEPLLMK
jgi:hypothetical protein